MGNVEILKHGDVQLTSAGTGIQHSEKTAGALPVHFLQIWSLPWKKGLAPKYFTRHYSDEEKKDRLLRIVAPVGSEGVSEESREGGGPTPVQSPLTLYAGLISPGARLAHKLQPLQDNAAAEKKGYVHVVQTSGYNTGAAKGNAIEVNGVKLQEGDGAFITGQPGEEVVLKNVGDGIADVLVFDLD